MGACPNCGAKTSPEHSFCLECGTPLERRSEREPAAAGPAAPGRTPTAGPTGPSLRATQDAARSRPQARSQDFAVPLVVSLVLSVALQLAMATVVPPDTYLHRLFRPAGGWIMGVVPGLIAFTFVWTLTDLFLKFRVARVNEADMARSEIARLPAQVAQEPTSASLQRLRSWDGRMIGRPVGHRVLSVLQHLDTVDSQRAHELIRHQSDIEADAAASGYRTVRLFIWAMPILGFIGTVLGISLAVGGFSDFLTTNVSIDEIDRVTAELGNVAQGLSFAFDTTLLGLLGGLFASVASSGVQAREERLLTRLEELGLRIMETSMPDESSGSATVATRHSDPAGEFDEMLKERLAKVSRQMEQFTRAVRVGLDGFLDEWAKLPPEIEKVTSDMTGLRTHLSSAAESMGQLILETRVLLEGLRDASEKMGTGLEASIGSVSDTVEGLGKNLDGISERLATSMLRVGERVTDSETHLQSGLADLRAAVERNARDGEGAALAVQALSESIGELGEHLRDFRESQKALAPVLSRLVGPLELRLTPRGD